MKKSVYIFKSLGIIFMILLFLQITPRIAMAAYTSFGYTYEYTNNATEIIITGYNGPDAHITIPSNIKGTPVTRINFITTMHPEALRSVGIPASVNKIGIDVFSNYPNLRALNFWGNAPQVLGNNPFRNNAADFKVYYLPGKTGFTNPWFGRPTEVLTAPLVDHAYYWADNFTYQINVDNSVTITKFQNGEYNVVIPELLEGHPVTKIGPKAFEGITNIKSITIANSVKSIGENAFAYCIGLESINIPNNIKSISNGLLNQCRKLTNIIIPNGVTSIGKDAFKDCSGLKSITLPDSLTTIGEAAFSSCKSLTDVMIPLNVTSIGANAYTRCDNLTSVSISNRLTSINYGAFQYCPKLGMTKFYGNAPTLEGNVFNACSPDFKVYYYAGTTGFTNPWQGYPTVVIPTLPNNSRQQSSSTIQLTINNPYLLIDGVKKETDQGFGTTPILKDNRTFLPVRALIEIIGGTMQWDGAERKVTIMLKGKKVELWIDKDTVRVNNINKTMDVAPFISSTGRTMLPLRFIGDNLDLDIKWDPSTQVVTIEYENIAPQPQSTSTPATGSWSGTWDTDWGILVLAQVGDKVTGTYDYYEGCELTGTVAGNTLTGSFVEKKGTENETFGLFTFVMKDDRTFEGRWGDNITPQDDWFYWDGERRVLTDSEAID